MSRLGLAAPLLLVEPLSGSPDAGCIDGNRCTVDGCVAGTCLHQAIPGCTP